jgi:hypothetical protein
MRVLVLVVAIGVLIAVGFANLAVHVAKGGKRLGAASDAISLISDFPKLIRRMRNADNYLRIQNDHHHFDKLGFTFNYPPNTRPNEDYLLLSRYDGDEGRSVVELWDLNSQTLKHTWRPPVDEFHRLAHLETNDNVLLRDENVGRMILRHALVLEDASLVYKSRSPLVRVSVCNKLIFQNDTDIFHHSTEMDDEGYFWVPTRIEPTHVKYVDKINFFDGAITRISPEGKIVFQRSVSELFLKYGYSRYVYGRNAYSDNPIHINDIQPVNSDGPYWKRGDVFVSLRTHSILMLYRPSTDEILWLKEGPWQHQHDVDVLDDHRISVFNNNSIESFPIMRSLGHSQVLVYDFNDGTVTSPWDDVLTKLDFHTETEGLHTIRPDGSIMLEEQNSGRLLMLDPKKEIDWQYVDGSSSGDIWRLGWSRLIDRAMGNKIVHAAETAKCD